MDMIVEGQIQGVTVDIGSGLKAKLAKSSKGFIKIEKTKTQKETEEA